ncbi:MAG: DUF4249 domain-containing protein [Cytophagaceae bacterium]|nr:DUF4249 domain-containing protein [Cytophagaceae bacterium]
MSKKTIFLFLVSLSLVFACVEPFDINFINQKEILFIDAHLTDSDQIQQIQIKKSFTQFNTNKILGEENAEVFVVEGNTKKYKCSFQGDGTYQLPSDFKIIPNTKYHLEFKLANGKEYKSSDESAIPINEIEKLSTIFNETEINFDGKEMNGHEVYLDTKDEAKDENFYMWKWKLFEQTNFCKTCYGGKYFTNPQPDGQCVEDAALKRRSVIYDYGCKTDCWQIYYSSELNILSDQYYNGSPITNRKIAEIPFLQFRGALVEVNQYGISKTAHDYFKIMINQSQNTGTLSDTPPAGLIGNVKNINDKTESIGGMFMVSIKKTRKIWIPRAERYVGVKAYGLFQGRTANPEPMGADITRPPMAPCQESYTRTSRKPDGWID